MAKDNTYEKLYHNLRDQFDSFLKHRNHCPQKCEGCKEWYDGVISETKKIKNKKQRKMLLNLWETLWLNNCKDFDVIAGTFDIDCFNQ